MSYSVFVNLQYFTNFYTTHCMQTESPIKADCEPTLINFYNPFSKNHGL